MACFGEQLRSSAALEGEREIHLHRIAFQVLADASLDPAQSRALILQTAQSLWSGSWQRVSATL
jgi:hypothetical protein